MTCLIAYLPRLDPCDPAGTIRLLRPVPPQRIGCNNWPERFPYAPEVHFRMAHNGAELFLYFQVREKCTQALVSSDNGEVWTDSCVEFFLAADDTGYYNFEFSCIGTMLLAFRKARPAALPAAGEILRTVRRYPSLGRCCFAEKQGDLTWQLLTVIPPSALFRHTFDSWSGLQARINLYKCGDRLSMPHYLSWQPVRTPDPDFHVPRFFKEVSFQTPRT